MQLTGWDVHALPSEGYGSAGPSFVNVQRSENGEQDAGKNCVASSLLLLVLCELFNSVNC